MLINFSSPSVGSARRKPKSEQAGAGHNCTDHLKIIDRCSSMATYSYTATINQYPQTKAEMKISCDRITEGLKCLKVHGKCLSNLARRSLGAYTTSRSRHSKRLCSNLNDSKVSDFMKAAECIRKENKVKPMVDSESQLISNLQFLSENTTLKWDDRFYQACCAASKYRIRSLKALEPQCTQYRSPTEDMLNSMIGELIDSVCPEDKKLNDYCVKQPEFQVPQDAKLSSLTKASIDLIVILADSDKE